MSEHCQEWHRWFAWYPVLISEKLVWLRLIETKNWYGVELKTLYRELGSKAEPAVKGRR